jgi:hypothetical protein
VVKLLETVHTLLRERPDVRIFPEWRCAATLIVLVLGDGRWVRRSFEKEYEDFEQLGSNVHGLGADFLQKVFDHVVLVPALSADQVQAYVDDVTDVTPWAITGRQHRAALSPAQRVATSPMDGALALAPAAALPPSDNAPTQPPAASEPGESGQPQPDHAPGPPETDPADAKTRTRSPAHRRRTGAFAGACDHACRGAHRQHRSGSGARPAGACGDRAAPRQDQQRLAEDVAAKAASKEAISAFTEHLLATYTPLMPANPRLVTRVANTFGMLMALGLHVRHHEPEDYVVRAAILFVRFPALVDELLSGDDPPVIDPADRAPAVDVPGNSAADAAKPTSWFRRDVQQVLRDEQGQLVDIVRLARCFGREYPPPTPAPTLSPGAKTLALPNGTPPGDGAATQFTQPRRNSDHARGWS